MKFKSTVCRMQVAQGKLHNFSLKYYTTVWLRVPGCKKKHILSQLSETLSPSDYLGWLCKFWYSQSLLIFVSSKFNFENLSVGWGTLTMAQVINVALLNYLDFKNSLFDIASQILQAHICGKKIIINLMYHPRGRMLKAPPLKSSEPTFIGNKM